MKKVFCALAALALLVGLAPVLTAQAATVTALDGSTIPSRANIDRRGKVLGEDTHPITQKSDRHAHTERGEMFFHNGAHGTLASAGTADHLLRVGATPIHLIKLKSDFQQATPLGEVDVTLYEIPTTTADGTAGTVLNRNRNFADTAPFSLFHGPTVTAVGTELETFIYSGSNQAVRNSDHDVEWILQPSTDYLIRIANVSGGQLDNYTIDIEGYAEAADTPLP